MRNAHWLSVILTGFVLGCSSGHAKISSPPNAELDASTTGPGSTLDSALPISDPNTAIYDADQPMGGETTPPMLGAPCNGRDVYCEKRYDELCQATTHDSAANSAAFWKFPTQEKTVRNQLDGGIRALMLSVQSYQNVATVCRRDCAEGNTALGVLLETVKGFLADNPREIVTLLIDTPLQASEIAAEFISKGLDSMAHAQTLGSSWPKLGEMIDAGHRLVVFANTTDSGPAWLLPRQILLWETRSNWTSLSAMNCNPDVGDDSRPLSLVHHNLVDLSDSGEASQPTQALASEANAFPIVTARLQACEAQFNRVPNFVAVDFFDLGDTVDATEVLNGVRAAH